VTLTNARIIQRFQDHMCGMKTNRADSMLFLSDISTIKDTVERKCLTCNGCSCSLCFLLLCFPIGFLCCLSRCCCAKKTPIPIGFIGGFGTEVFTFSSDNVSQALSDIPAAAMPYKTSNRCSGNQTF
jgi:hypothetical protein